MGINVNEYNKFFKSFLNNHSVNTRIKEFNAVNNVTIDDYDVTDYIYCKDANIKHFSNCCNSNNNNLDNCSLSFYKLFISFKELGKDLYKINRTNLNKIIISKNYYDISFSPFGFINSYNRKTIDTVIKWFNKYGYCVEIDKDVNDGHIIEIRKLTNLSILTYLLSESFKTYYLERNEKKPINFSDFITIKKEKNTDTIKNEDYIINIQKVMFAFEKIGIYCTEEHSELMYIDNSLKLIHYYQNIYSIVLYVLNLYIINLSAVTIANPTISQCGCGIYNEGKNKKCKSCKKIGPSERKAKSRKDLSEKMERIQYLISNYTYDDNLIIDANEILNMKKAKLDTSKTKVNEILDKLEKKKKIN